MDVPAKLADSASPIVRRKAEELTAGEASLRGKLERIFEYVRDEILFAFPEDGDFVKASDTIRLGMGQCNTKSTLFLALCQAAGIPARVHYSSISRDIQKGFFTGPAFWLMPKEISHSWIEVEVDGEWRRIDTFINDRPLFEAAVAELDRRGWQVGFSLASNQDAPSCNLSLDEEEFQQMGAVADDHGVWEEPADYFASDQYQNRPGRLRGWLYRGIIGKVNARVEALRRQS